MGELLIRMVFSLAVVVGLLILISRVAATRFQGRSGSPIEVLHRQALGKSTSVSVVQVGGRVLVLGTTEHQVNVLTELEPSTMTEDAASEDLAAWDGELDAEAYGEPVSVPSLEALLAEPDRVTLEELFGHRPPATAAAPSFDTAPAPAYAATPAVTAVETTGLGMDPDPILPEDPSYAAFASQLRAQLASGSYVEPATGARSGRHAAPVPAFELPPTLSGGARAARVVQVPTSAPPPAAAAVASPAVGPAQAGPTAADLAALRAALLAAQVQASSPAPAARPAGVPDGALAGSVLSPSTWRLAFRAVNRRAS